MSPNSAADYKDLAIGACCLSRPDMKSGLTAGLVGSDKAIELAGERSPRGRSAAVEALPLYRPGGCFASHRFMTRIWLACEVIMLCAIRRSIGSFPWANSAFAISTAP